MSDATSKIGTTWRSTYPDEYGTPHWDVVFTCTNHHDEYDLEWFDWKVYERVATYEDGRPIYIKDGRAIAIADRETTDIGVAIPLIDGGYRNDHNGERIYWDNGDQPDVYAEEFDAFLSMLKGARDEMRAWVEKHGGQGDAGE